MSNAHFRILVHNILNPFQTISMPEIIKQVPTCVTMFKMLLLYWPISQCCNVYFAWTYLEATLFPQYHYQVFEHGMLLIAYTE